MFMIFKNRLRDLLSFLIEHWWLCPVWSDFCWYLLLPSALCPSPQWTLHAQTRPGPPGRSCSPAEGLMLMIVVLVVSYVLFTFSAVSPLALSCLCWVKMMVKTAWDRLELSFMLVAATVLDLLPSSIRLAISWASATATGVRPSTYGPRTLCSLVSFF